MKARTDWYEETLLPKLTNMFWKGLFVACGAFLGTFIAALFFIVESKIDRHTLDATNTMGSQYVKVVQHTADISRIEKKVDAITEGNQQILSALDRNLQEIRDRR